MDKRILFLLGLSLIGFGAGYYLLKLYECGYSVFCYTLITKSFAIYYGAGALAIVFLILLFVPRAFGAWKKFAIWFVPLAALLFAFYPDPGSGDFLSPYPEQVFQWVSALYVLISLIIIAVSSFRQKTAQN